MTDASKLTLSAEELQLAENTQWILTKRTIIDTTVLLFGQVAVQMQQHIAAMQDQLPAAITQSTPKITKGENYLLLPYVILDYPRSFEKENIFAVRTMFWWGNFISITLHVSGTNKKMLQQVLQTGSCLEQLDHYYLCISEAEWQHHFAPDNYIPMHTLTAGAIEEITSRSHFIKVAAKFDLQQWNEIQPLLEKEFLKLVQLVKC